MINENLDNKFNISYAFCVNKFLQDKFESNTQKYNNMKKIMKQQDIEIFYGDNDDYFDKLYNWIIG